MNTLPKLEELIVSYDTRGDGSSIPYRQIAVVSTKTGDLVALGDVYSFTIEQIKSALVKMNDDDVITLTTKIAGISQLINKYFISNHDNNAQQ